MKELLPLCMGLSLLYSISAVGQVSLNMEFRANVDGINANYNDIWGYTYNGSEYAVIGSDTKMTILDVTDCANPVIVHTWDNLTSTIWRDIKDYGDYIYFCQDGGTSDGLLIIRKSDYAHFTHNINSSDEFNRAHNLFIDTLHGRLYVAGSNFGTQNNIQVYDLVANPQNPPLLVNVNLKTLVGDNSSSGYYLHDIYVRDHILYGFHGDDGLRIWDFTDVSNIQLLGGQEFPGLYCHSGWLHDTEPILYTAFEVPLGQPMYVLDVSDPNEIDILYTFKDVLTTPSNNNATPHNPFVKDDLLFISYYHDGTKVYDITQPDTPALVAYYDTYPNNTNYSGYNGNWGVYPYLPSGCILSSDRATGLYTTRLTIPTDKLMTITNGDLYFSSDSINLFMNDLDNNRYTLEVDVNDFTIKTASRPNYDPEVSVKKTDLDIKSPGRGIIIRQGSRHYRISVDTNGELFALELVGLPTQRVTIPDSGLYLDHYAAGVILHNFNNDCFKLNVDHNGALQLEAVACP